MCFCTCGVFLVTFSVVCLFCVLWLFSWKKSSLSWQKFVISSFNWKIIKVKVSYEQIKMWKTADFKFWQTMSISPSLHRQLSTFEKNSQKWCFDEKEEGGEGHKFCQTMWVHHKIITNDNFSTEFCSFAKTILHVCIETIMFLERWLLAFTRLLFLQSQKLMLLLLVMIPQLFIISFSHIWMICMLFCQFYNMNNNLRAQEYHFDSFFLLIRCHKIMWNCIAWNADLQWKCWSFFKNNKMSFINFFSYRTHYSLTKYDYSTCLLVLRTNKVDSNTFCHSIWIIRFASKSCDVDIGFRLIVQLFH